MPRQRRANTQTRKSAHFQLQYSTAWNRLKLLPTITTTTTTNAFFVCVHSFSFIRVHVFFPPFCVYLLAIACNFIELLFISSDRFIQIFFFASSVKWKGKKIGNFVCIVLVQKHYMVIKISVAHKMPKYPGKNQKKKREEKNTSAYTRYHTTTVIHSRASDWSSFVAFAMDCAKPILPVSSSSSLVLDHA